MVQISNRLFSSRDGPLDDSTTDTAAEMKQRVRLRLIANIEITERLTTLNIGAQFSLDVFVSGYASISRPPDSATRSQKAFMRVAKGLS